MGDCIVVGTQIIYALIIALEEGQYKLVQVFEAKEECKVVERQQTVLARCFRVNINKNFELNETVDIINSTIQ